MDFHLLLVVDDCCARDNRARNNGDEEHGPQLWQGVKSLVKKENPDSHENRRERDKVPAGVLPESQRRYDPDENPDEPWFPHIRCSGPRDCDGPDNHKWEEQADSPRQTDAKILQLHEWS